MGFLDRLLGRPKQRPAPDPSTTTIAAVNQSYANPGYRKYFSDREPRRKAIASVSRWQSTYGIQRPGYSPAEIDRLAENVIYAMCEKRCMDYASTAEWTVEDGEGAAVDAAIQFLSKPNPQDTFSSLLVATIPDIMRGDCGCWVKTFNGLEKLAELRAYNGDEFWPEVDRGFSPVEGLRGEATYGVYSHGYIVRWWQHSAPGIYVPYDPAEIVYIRMYPRSDSPFGTSLLQRVKWQLEYLIDSTAAAGMTFANGVMPGLEWNHANLQGPEQLAEMIVDREERYVGVQNAGGIIDTFEGDTLKPLTPSMVDMQWLDGQKLVSETVWAYFGFPASEFLMGDTNRATAYIARNIVKSSVLAPMLSRIEEYINGCVLPDLEGYQPDWTFKFIESVDKDDELKDVQVLQGRQQIAMGYYQMGMPLLMCLRLAGLPEEDIEAVKQEEIDAPDIDADLPGSTFAQTDDGPVTEQYTGTDASQAHEGGDEGIQKGRREDMKPGEEWITMNGTHVLVKDGEIQSHDGMKEKIGTLKRTPGTSQGAPRKEEGNEEKELNNETTNSSNMEPESRRSWPEHVHKQALAGETYDGVTYRMTTNDAKKTVPEEQRAELSKKALATVDADKARLGKMYGLRKREVARQNLMSARDYRLGLGQGKLDKIRGVSYTGARTTSEFNMGYHEGWNDNPSHWKEQREMNPNFWAHDNKTPVTRED